MTKLLPGFTMALLRSGKQIPHSEESIEAVKKSINKYEKIIILLEEDDSTEASYLLDRLCPLCSFQLGLEEKYSLNVLSCWPCPLQALTSTNGCFRTFYPHIKDSNSIAKRLHYAKAQLAQLKQLLPA